MLFWAIEQVLGIHQCIKLRLQDCSIVSATWDSISVSLLEVLKQLATMFPA